MALVTLSIGGNDILLLLAELCGRPWLHQRQTSRCFAILWRKPRDDSREASTRLQWHARAGNVLRTDSCAHSGCSSVELRHGGRRVIFWREDRERIRGFPTCFGAAWG